MSAMPIDLALAWRSLPDMFGGLLVTMTLMGIVLLLGFVLSIPVALARMSRRKILAWPAAVFVTFFRGSPLLILLYLVYYGLGQIEAIRNGPLWFILGNAFACAVIGLTLNHVAFMVDVIRGSLLAVPAGLTEASKALGLTPRETFFWIQMPIAMRYGLKAYQNEVILFTKGTALVGVLPVTDITSVANALFEETYDPFTPILTAAVFYWVLINLQRIALGRLERYLNRHQRVDVATRPAVRRAGMIAPAAVEDAELVSSQDAASLVSEDMSTAKRPVGVFPDPAGIPTTVDAFPTKA